MTTRIVLALAAIILTVGCGAPPESAPGEDQPREPDPVEAPESEEAEEPTMAEVWASSARATLDMRMETFFDQMPDDLVGAQWSRSPSGQRVNTMTWSDGSVVIARWEPSAIPGDGLRLAFIEKIGK